MVMKMMMMMHIHKTKKKKREKNHRELSLDDEHHRNMMVFCLSLNLYSCSIIKRNFSTEFCQRQHMHCCCLWFQFSNHAIMGSLMCTNMHRISPKSRNQMDNMHGFGSLM